MNTYHRNTQLGASRRRLEDAEACLDKKRWMAAIYLGGYAIECALKAYICYREQKTDFRDTSMYPKFTGSAGHNLQTLYNAAGAPVMRSMLDPQGEFPPARQLVLTTWKHADLRYSDKSGSQDEAKAFVEAVKILHGFLLGRL